MARIEENTKASRDFDRKNQNERCHLAGPRCRWENNIKT
jgi:hypothetical protein